MHGRRSSVSGDLANEWKCENINVRAMFLLIGRLRIPGIITKACSTGSINMLKDDMRLSLDHKVGIANGILIPIDLHSLEDLENEDLKNSIANSEK